MTDKKLLIIRLSDTFIEPSCSYPTSFAAYSHTFTHFVSLLDFSNIRYQLVEFTASGLTIDQFKSDQLNLPLDKAADLFLQKLNHNFSATLDPFLPSSSGVIIFGGLFARYIPTSVLSSIALFCSQYSIPILRIGNFASTHQLFDFTFPKIDHINFVDVDPVPLATNWLKKNGLISPASYSNLQLLGSILLNSSADIPDSVSTFIARFADHHAKFLTASQFSHSTALKQRVLSVGFGCPQSCTFCPSRLTSSENYSPHYIARLLYRINNFVSSSDDKFIVDLLHADPLVHKKSFFAALKLFLDSVEEVNLVFRIQTRVALVKSLSTEELDLLARAGVRLIYVGLETISIEVSRKNRKYNNSVDDFLMLRDTLLKKDVHILANLVIGLPEDTADVIADTRQFVDQHWKAVGNVAPFRPIPGTPEGSVEVLSSIFQIPQSSMSPEQHQRVLHQKYINVFQSRYAFHPKSPALAHFSDDIKEVAVKLLRESSNAVAKAYTLTARCLTNRSKV